MSEHQNQPEGQLTSQTRQQGAGSRAGETIDEITSTLRDLFNRVPDTFSKAVERAINVRDTTVLLRLSEELMGLYEITGLGLCSGFLDKTVRQRVLWVERSKLRLGLLILSGDLGKLLWQLLKRDIPLVEGPEHGQSCALRDAEPIA